MIIPVQAPEPSEGLRAALRTLSEAAGRNDLEAVEAAHAEVTLRIAAGELNGATCIPEPLEVLLTICRDRLRMAEAAQAVEEAREKGTGLEAALEAALAVVPEVAESMRTSEADLTGVAELDQALTAAWGS